MLSPGRCLHILILMKHTEIVAGIAADVCETLRLLGAKRAILFGSYARGTQDEKSDIDILIIDDRDEPYAERIERYFRPLDKALLRPLEILVYTSDELDRAADRPFLRTVLREGIDLYEHREATLRG